MKIKNLLLSGMFFALIGLITISCNENSSDPDPDNNTPDVPEAPTNLMASSVDRNTVNLSWTASTTANVTYTISWDDGEGNSGMADLVAATNYLATVGDNIDNPDVFTFSVVAVDTDGETSTALELEWSGAWQYLLDGDNPSKKIRMYEKSSQNGSGLVLDPGRGGPKNVSVASYSPLSEIQLGFTISSTTPTQFVIGPAYSMTEFENANDFDQNVFVSDEIVAIPSLEEWYLSESLDNFIGTEGNLQVFEDLANSRTDGNGLGFIVRTGFSSNYHYARIFIIPDTDGNLVRGTTPDRFVELHISYQNILNRPYAKGNNARAETAGTATRRR